MLSAVERHGYGIGQDIVAHTERRIALESGNLYRHVRRLQSEGWWEKQNRVSEHDDERRI